MKDAYICSMTSIYRFFSTALLLLVLVCSCNENKKSDKFTIVTTTGIIADCITNIVGDDVTVISLMGAGVDPHLYRASQGDIEKLTSADIIVYNGLHLEGKMAKMLENYAQQKPTFAVGDYVNQTLLKRVDETSDLVDPHIWLNPEIWMSGIKGVAEELSAAAPELRNAREKFVQYNEEVSQLTTVLKQQLDTTLDSDKRILITSHDAFAYFGDAFGFRVRGLQGISTAAEYGTRDVKDLVDFIIDQDIKSVFIETSVSDKNLTAVIDGAKMRDYPLSIGGTLYSDALGKNGTPAGTYTGMLKANVNTIVAGLK